MRLSPNAFRTFWSYHSWLGVVAALLLHVMCLAGVATLFKAPLSVWEEPLNHRPAQFEGSLQRYLEIGSAAAGTEHPSRLLLVLPKTHGTVRLQYPDAETGRWVIGWVDPTRGEFVARRERLSDFLYHLHFLRLPFTGLLELLAGVAAVALFVTIVTGLLIQLHRLLRELTQFRPAARTRTVASDLHKVLGVLGLPFQALYAFSGAFLIFAPLLAELAAGPFFAGRHAEAYQAIWGSSVDLRKAKQLVSERALGVDELLRRAQKEVPNFHADAIRIEQSRQSGGLVRFYGTIERERPFDEARVVLEQANGRVLHLHTAEHDKSSNSFYRAVTGLHYANFDGPILRFIFAMLTLGTCATLLTGNWLWLVRHQRAGFGQKVLARLTVGIGAGSIVAIALLFLGSRLLPLSTPHRIFVEETLFASTLGGCVIWAWVSRNLRALWWKQLAIASVGFLATPPASQLLTNAGLFGSGVKVSPVVWVDVSLLLLGLVAGVSAWILHARSKASSAGILTRVSSEQGGRPSC